MTNADKFKQIFGFWPEVRMSEAMCNAMFCGDQECDGCRYYKENDEHICWGDEYEEIPGKWISLDNGWNGYKCSSCGHVEHTSRPKYCPMCGSRNDKEVTNGEH